MPPAPLFASQGAHEGPRQIFTICSKNYLPLARELAASVLEHEPSARVTVILSDEADDVSAISDYLGVSCLPGRELPLPTYYDMAMRYDIVEFNTALKPAAFLHFMDKGAGSIVYLDPDIQLHRPLTDVWDAIAEGAQGVITPHICQPLDMEKNPTELKIMRTGIYNLGFAALANTEDARKFAEWWGRRMPADCRVDLDAGVFVDQKYVDLMPSYLPRTKILRHPGYNVAYWNLAHRPLARATNGFTAAGQPLVFMHFSGIREDKADFVSVHQDRVSVADLGEGRALFDAYREKLRGNRKALKEAGIAAKYAYGQFLTGEEIPKLVRTVYAKSVPPSAKPFEEVFDLAKGPFNQGATGITHKNQHLISPVMADLWLRKPHLQVAFNIRNAKEAKAYALWFVETGYREWDIAPAFIPKAAFALTDEKRSVRARMAVFTMKLMEKAKFFAFMYPKPVRRAATRFNRRVAPQLAKRIKTR
ncbi:hypothetical protein HK107_10510 [Parvularcula sp. ZS-1/3]|uniref:Glycosyl transferase n=1 Tax=Parvularcula mediterranea TaxID=2732508 RepID=A0A7Y3RNB9_9PROT|nr:hypothetical protein [Parvularcula mediterranea]NNU16751.1 hypothetical protein [Parvularcula mediterranea]